MILIASRRASAKKITLKNHLKARVQSTSMATFKLDNASGSAACEVKLCEGLTEEQLRSHKPFKQWYDTLQANLRTQWQQSHAFYNSPYTLRSLEIQAVDRFGHDRIGFLKLKAEVKNDDGESLPGAVFLRGGSVAMLVCHLFI